MLNLILVVFLLVHDDPDALVAYPLQSADVTDSKLRAQLGPDIDLSNQLDFVPDELGGGAELYEDDRLIISSDFRKTPDLLPEREMTVSAWMSVGMPRQWGGVLGCVQDYWTNH